MWILIFYSLFCFYISMFLSKGFEYKKFFGKKIHNFSNIFFDKSYLLFHYLDSWLVRDLL